MISPPDTQITKSFFFRLKIFSEILILVVLWEFTRRNDPFFRARVARVGKSSSKPNIFDTPTEATQEEILSSLIHWAPVAIGGKDEVAIDVWVSRAGDF